MSIYRRKISQTEDVINNDTVGGNITHHKNIETKDHGRGGGMIIPDYKYINNAEYRRTDDIKYPKKLLDRLLEENFRYLTTNEKLIVMYKTQAIRLEDLENKLFIIMCLLALIIFRMYTK